MLLSVTQISSDCLKKLSLLPTKNTDYTSDIVFKFGPRKCQGFLYLKLSFEQLIHSFEKFKIKIFFLKSVIYHQSAQFLRSEVPVTFIHFFFFFLYLSFFNNEKIILFIKFCSFIFSLVSLLDHLRFIFKSATIIKLFVFEN